MKDFFAIIYENVLYNGSYDLIYTAMFDDQGYISIGLAFIFIPFAFLTVFYFERWMPYLKAWHWILTVLIGLVVVFASTVGLFNITIFGTGNQQLANLIASPGSGFNEHASSLRYYYGFYNMFLAFIVSLIYSAIFKRFSKLHSHLPL